MLALRAPLRAEWSTPAVVAALVVSLLVIGLSPVARGNAGPSTAPNAPVNPSLVVTNVTVPLCSTPIFGGGPNSTLNNTTCRPWGEAFDPVTGCLFVTEDPATPATMGYLTALGPGNPIFSVPIPGGDNPQGIAWARAYLGEPAGWSTLFPGGILLVADTGSNGLSLFGMKDIPGTPPCLPTFLGTMNFYVNWNSGAQLASPFDVVFGLKSHLFYVTWYGSNVTGAYSGLTPGCELFNLSKPAGLSYGYGFIYIANFMANGWVTSMLLAPTNVLPGACTTAVANSAPILDRGVWTTPAPVVFGEPTTAGPLVATSDANWGIAGNLIGTGCATGTPTGAVVGLLNRASLACLNSTLLLNGSAPPVTPALNSYGDTWARTTRHVYTVVQNLTTATPGMVEATTYSAVFATEPVGITPIEVIWIPSLAPFFTPTPATAGMLVVTNLDSGTLTMMTAF